MTRAFLLLPLAALAAGCYSSNPCYAPFLNVYWTPGSPNGGFQVPGLPAPPDFPAAQLGCVDAGVDAVEVTVGGLLQPCEPGFCGSGANAGRWQCDVRGRGGISVSLNVGGTYEVTVDAFDSSGNLKYSSPVVLAGASDCGDSAVGVFSQGVAGTLDIGYQFTPVNACGASGSNIWFELLDPAGSIYATVTPASPTQITCPQTISLATVPAGIYTLSKFEDGLGATTYHADCAGPAFVHAGDEIFVATVPASSTACFP